MTVKIANQTTLFWIKLKSSGMKTFFPHFSLVHSVVLRKKKIDSLSDKPYKQQK